MTCYYFSNTFDFQEQNDMWLDLFLLDISIFYVDSMLFLSIFIGVDYLKTEKFVSIKFSGRFIYWEWVGLDRQEK